MVTYYRRTQFSNRYHWEYSILLLRYYFLPANLILLKTSGDIFYRHWLKKTPKQILKKILLRAYLDYCELLWQHCVNFTLLNIKEGPSPLERHKNILHEVKPIWFYEIQS